MVKKMSGKQAIHQLDASRRGAFQALHLPAALPRNEQSTRSPTKHQINAIAKGQLSVYKEGEKIK